VSEKSSLRFCTEGKNVPASTDQKNSFVQNRVKEVGQNQYRLKDALF